MDIAAPEDRRITPGRYGNLTGKIGAVCQEADRLVNGVGSFELKDSATCHEGREERDLVKDHRAGVGQRQIVG
jgi:hypothetical protein